MASIQETLAKAAEAKAQQAEKKELPTPKTKTIEAVFARTRRGYQCGDTILRPNLNLEVIPTTKEELQRTKELLEVGVFFIANKVVPVEE